MHTLGVNFQFCMGTHFGKGNNLGMTALQKWQTVNLILQCFDKPTNLQSEYRDWLKITLRTGTILCAQRFKKISGVYILHETYHTHVKFRGLNFRVSIGKKSGYGGLAGTIVVVFAKCASYCGLIFVDKRHTTKYTQKFMHLENFFAYVLQVEVKQDSAAIGI